MTTTKHTEPCWEITCDLCGEGDNTEYGCCYHHPSRDEAIEAVCCDDWRVGDDGTALCADCIEQIDEHVDCPECRVGIGQRCADPHGGRAQNPCPARVEAGFALAVTKRAKSQ